MKIVISSGHGLYVRGASCDVEPWGLDEVDEARRVVPELCNWLKLHGHDVEELHDDVSKNQDANLKWIVQHHNAFPAEDRRDVSIHFNAYTVTTGMRGVECCYVSQHELASKVSAAISSVSGLIDRGAQYRSDLYFLNKTTGSLGAILVEVCFVDAKGDTAAYDQHFESICSSLAEALLPVSAPVAFRKIGKVSWFGGPEDLGVSSSEGVALENEGVNPDDAPELFLDYQPSGTTGNARRLNSDGASYLAMRWDYDQFSKHELASGDLMFWVKATKTGKKFKARPADWGPASETGRLADVSRGLLEALEIETDDEIEITQV